MKRFIVLRSSSTIGLCLALVTGCGDVAPEEGGGDVNSSGFNYDAEPGTCDGWKVRFCQAFIQCGHGTKEECIHQAEFIQCATNAPYSACEAEFQKVIDKEDCSLFPDECYPRDISNRTGARELCEDVQEAACEYDFFCGYAFNLETCITETSHLYECDRRLSAVPGGEACVKELNRAACGEQLPAVCADHTRF